MDSDDAARARRRVVPKVPKGTRDYLPADMAIRDRVVGAAVSAFKRHGAVAIDTPTFELRETLMGKYGEDGGRLVYDLADQGGEALSLRYDLTVPFARFMAANRLGNVKRYQVGKVFRRDQPMMSRGRCREFLQCDMDVCGAYAPMAADAEVVKVLVEVLDDVLGGLPLPQSSVLPAAPAYEVRLNHRGLLDAALSVAGVPADALRPVCSAVDKLDKEPWEAVRRELVRDKGVAEAVADRVGELVAVRGPPLETLDALLAGPGELGRHPAGRAAVDELRTLFGHLQDMGALGPVVLDLSLARGLDYYTGVIFEAVVPGAAVGSVAAGGRYDGLVGMFASAGAAPIPAVGVSVGVERLFLLLRDHYLRAGASPAGGQVPRESETEVLVASAGHGLLTERMRLASALWAAGVKAEFDLRADPRMKDQLAGALEARVPLVVVVGHDEREAGVVKVKDMRAREESVVAAADLVPEVKRRLAAMMTSSL